MRVGILTQYPGITSENDCNLSGVAAFSKYLYDDFQNEKLELTIFANTQGEKTSVKKDNNEVCYCWEKGINPFFNVFKELIKRKVEILHIHHELYLYGGLMANLFLLFFILMCRIRRIRVVVEFHATLSLKKIDKKFLNDNRLPVPPFVAKCCFYIFYKFIYYLTNSVIAHEQLFRNILISEYHMKEERVFYVPLPCKRPDIIYTNAEAKGKIGVDSNKRMILYLGYISGYKGLDCLIEASHKFLQREDTILYIAGGMHPRLKNDESYINYVQRLKDNIVREKTVWHGYAEEEELPILFCAADVVVFPYTVGMSSSGPLSQAVSYKKPFVVSDAFDGIVLERECVYGSTSEQLADKLQVALEDRMVLERLLEYSIQMSDERTPQNLQEKLTSIYSKIMGE